MKIIKAKSLGMCFGVKRAIGIALKLIHEGNISIYGCLVHNQVVQRHMEEKGVLTAVQPEGIGTQRVLIGSHGVSHKTWEQIRSCGHTILEATCPLVKKAHAELMALVSEGFYPVIIGQVDHVEVKGMSEDLVCGSVVLTDLDVEKIPPQPRYGVVAQTTQPLEIVKSLLQKLRFYHPDAEIVFRDTICHPTKQRQEAAIELAKQSDLVLVIGGLQSNNTRELAATCRRYCGRVMQIETSADCRREWFDGVEVVGLTAGASSPDESIYAVEAWLECMKQAELQQI